MSYYIYDVDGYVGDLASNSGLVALRKYVEAKGGEISNVLFDGGSIRSLDKLKTELEEMDKPTDQDISSTLQNLIDLVSKCKDIAIITDGVFGDATD